MHTQIEDNQFTFANIINIIRHLDLDKQRKALLTKPSQEKIPIIKNSIAYNPEDKIQQKYNNVTSIISKTNSMTIDAVMETTKILLTKLSEDVNKSHPNPQINQQEQQMEKEFKQIRVMPISTMNTQKTNLSTHETINPTALSVNATNEDSAIIGSQCFSQFATNVITLQPIDSNITAHAEQSPCHERISDPRFYVCTSFSTNDIPNTKILPHHKTNLTSNITISSVAGSSPTSSKSSQSYPYHDYCLSEKDFDITQSNLNITQSTSSDLAKINTCRIEADIFREIEGDAFDEKAFFNSCQAPLNINFFDKNDK